MNRQNKLDADPKAIQHIELIGKLKNANGHNVDGTQSIHVCFNDFQKNQRNKTKIFSRKCESHKRRCIMKKQELKPTNTKLNKLK